MAKQQQMVLFTFKGISVKPFRDACEEAVQTGQFSSWAALAVACGYERKLRGREGQGDMSRLKRTLGIYGTSPSSRARYPRMGIHAATALNIIRALGRDPVDFGL
jgi:hypothetical protein